MKKCILLFFTALMLSLPIQSQASDQIKLEAIGALSASDVYMKYIALGVLGDAYDNGAYKEAMIQETTIQIANLCDVTKDQFIQMQQNNVLSGEDVRYAIKMIETYGYLKSQADALHTYSRTGNIKDANTYQTYRQLAWDNIVILLDLK